MSRGLRAVAVSSVWSIIACCVIILRIYCRFVLVKQSGADDYLATAALVFSVVLTVCIGLRVSFPVPARVLAN